MAGINSLSTTFSTEVKWNAQNNLVGQVYNPITNSGDIRKNYSVGTAAANNVSQGGDQFFSFQQVILGGSSATIDLTQMTNIMQQTTVNIVRVKAYQIRLLATADDSTIQTPVASSITVTNSGVATPSQLDFGSGGTGLTVNLVTSSGAITSASVGSGGSGYLPSSTFMVAPVQAGGSGGALYVNTNASGVIQNVTLAGSPAAGVGYSNATVNTVEVGKYTVYSGGAHMYLDTQAAGFLTVSSLNKLFTIYNNDATNKATVEVSVVGAST